MTRAAVAVEVVAQRLDHHSLRRRDRPQRCELVAIERAGVRVRQQSRFSEHERGHVVQVVYGGVVTVVAQPLLGDVVAQLGSLAEGEERLVASHARTLLGDGEHLVGGEIGVVEPRGRLGERAIATLVATQHRERDEHLRRVGDAGAEVTVTNRASIGQQLVERRVEYALASRQRDPPWESMKLWCQRPTRRDHRVREVATS